MKKFSLYDTGQTTDGKSDFTLKEPILASFPSHIPQADNLQKMNFTIMQQ